MESTILKTEGLKAYYGETKVLRGIDIDIPRNRVTAVMGPSGCGKTTLIRCFNRMHEMVPGARIEGKIRLEGRDITSMKLIQVRRMVGMVFQKPNPFPTMSIYDNVLAGYRLSGVKLRKEEAQRIVEESLKKAALWEEVKDALHRRGTFLSGGQQQRLCIARALAVNPRLLLMDEPTSALDPKAAHRVEELISRLKETVTVVVVTHNVAQAGRVADYTAFLYLGELIEFGPTSQLFTAPQDPRTEEYLTGKFG
ncbi:MAG: phosphate ABC transporter ATP-binding protein [Aquificota bacterium]|nr:MAG: phosphate ABC transporter ATP-binding protein [Aquificota bacterium]